MFFFYPLYVDRRPYLKDRRDPYRSTIRVFEGLKGQFLGVSKVVAFDAGLWRSAAVAVKQGRQDERDDIGERARVIDKAESKVPSETERRIAQDDVFLPGRRTVVEVVSLDEVLVAFGFNIDTDPAAGREEFIEVTATGARFDEGVSLRLESQVLNYADGFVVAVFRYGRVRIELILVTKLKLIVVPAENVVKVGQIIRGDPLLGDPTLHGTGVDVQTLLQLFYSDATNALLEQTKYVIVGRD